MEFSQPLVEAGLSDWNGRSADVGPRRFPAAASAAPVAVIAAAFVPRARGLFIALGMPCAYFSAHVEPCIGASSALANDDVLYYLSISTRARSPDGDAAGVLEALRGSWQQAGWRVERFERVEDGRMRLAAVDPDSGCRYALDCGLQAGRRGIVVGLFTTPSYAAPGGSVRFGALKTG